MQQLQVVCGEDVGGFVRNLIQENKKCTENCQQLQKEMKEKAQAVNEKNLAAEMQLQLMQQEANDQISQLQEQIETLKASAKQTEAKA